MGPILTGKWGEKSTKLISDEQPRIRQTPRRIRECLYQGAEQTVRQVQEGHNYQNPFNATKRQDRSKDVAEGAKRDKIGVSGIK